MAEREILDLSTGVERPTIRIDGKAFEMRTPDEFSWHQNQMISKNGRRFQNLVKRMETDDGLTDEETRKLQDLSKDMVDQVVVDLPEEIADKLKPLHQLKIFEAFTKLSREMKEQNTPDSAAAESDPGSEPEAKPEPDRQDPNPGDKPPANCSPESSDSMEATQSSG
jgi:hypothetical protein